MKRKLIILLLLLSSCAHYQHKDQCGEITLDTFASDLNAGDFTEEIGADCSRKVTISSPSSAQSQAFGLAVEKAVEGAVKGAKP